MNAKQRQQLEKYREIMESIAMEIRDMAEVEEQKFDNLSEGLQCTCRGEALQESADSLNMLSDDIENLLDSIDEITNL